MKDGFDTSELVKELFVSAVCILLSAFAREDFESDLPNDERDSDFPSDDRESDLAREERDSDLKESLPELRLDLRLRLVPSFLRSGTPNGSSAVGAMIALSKLR